MKKLLNNQLYIGRTKLSEDDIFKLLDFEYTDLENDLSLCMFSILMDIGWFDEDYAFTEFNKNKSLSHFLNYIKDMLDLDINDEIINIYDNIDFIISIDAYEGEANEPKVKHFQNSFLEIEYLGSFASK